MAPPSNSQDPDAKFAIFLNPIRDLTKNWEVDIAKFLEDYLEELAEIRITFNGGDTTMNFAEAALLIQGSATVYSKKVEFLWQMVLQMLDLLANKKSADSTVDGAGGKKSSKGIHDYDAGFVSVEDIVEGKSIDIRDEDDCAEVEDIRKTFKFLPCTPLHLVEKESEKSQYRISLYLSNQELLGAKDDYRINRSYITSNGVLSLDIPSATFLALGTIDEELETQLEDCVENMEQGNSEDAPQATDQPHDSIDEGLPPDVPFEPLPPISEEDNITNDDDDGGPPASPPPPSEQPSEAMEVDQADKRKSGEGSDIIEFAPRSGLRSKGEKEKVVLKLNDPLKPCDPHIDTPAKRPIRAGRIRKPAPCKCHAPTKQARKRDKNKEDIKTDKKTLPNIEEVLASSLISTKSLQPTGDLKLKDIFSVIVEEAIKEENKRNHLIKDKKMKDLINSRRARNLLEAEEKIQEETQLQEQFDEQIDDGLDNDAPVLNEFEDDTDQLLTQALPDPHCGNIEMEYGQIPTRLNRSMFDEPESEYEGLVQKWIGQYISNAQEYIASSDLAIRVNKWRENITPLLEEEEKRTAFDIHSYGSNILSFFPDGLESEKVSFEKIVAECEVKEVSRYFLSSLMLANTGNVEISQSKIGDLAMDCTELKFLSNTRHHEEIQEYAAPSQGVGNPSRLTPKRKNKSRKSVNHILEEDEDVNHNTQDSRASSPVSSICSDITDEIQKTNHNQANIKRQKQDKKIRKKASAR